MLSLREGIPNAKLPNAKEHLLPPATATRPPLSLSLSLSLSLFTPHFFPLYSLNIPPMCLRRTSAKPAARMAARTSAGGTHASIVSQ